MQKTYEWVKGKCVEVIGGGLALVAGSASAAVPATVTAALADMQADALVIAAIFLVAVIALTAFLFMRKGAK